MPVVVQLQVSMIPEIQTVQTLAETAEIPQTHTVEKFAATPQTQTMQGTKIPESLGITPVC